MKLKYLLLVLLKMRMACRHILMTKLMMSSPNENIQDVQAEGDTGLLPTAQYQWGQYQGK